MVGRGGIESMQGEGSCDYVGARGGSKGRPGGRGPPVKILPPPVPLNEVYDKA